MAPTPAPDAQPAVIGALNQRLFPEGSAAHFLFNVGADAQHGPQRFVLQLPPLPAGVEGVRARHSDAGELLPPLWTDVQPSEVGSLCVKASGRVFYTIGKQRFEAFPGVDKQLPARLLAARNGEPSYTDLGPVAKTLVLYPLGLEQ